MAVTEQERHDLANRAHEVLGDDAGATLMELLPPAGWGEVVTREVLHAELAAMRAETGSEFTDVRTEMRTGFAEVRAEFAEVRTEFAEVRAEMRTEFAEVRAEMRTGFAEVRTELHRELRELYVKGLTGIGIMVGAATAIAALIR